MYAKTPRTTSLRERDRMTYGRQAAHDILDEAWHCTVSFVVDGEPRTLPTLFVRVDDAVYVHASTGSRPFLAARLDGIGICFSVTHLDGLVLARSQFHHSANYRSLVAHGVATLVTDEAEKSAVLTALVEKLGTGRAASTRPPDAKELAQTAMLRLPLHEVSVRTREGGVNDEPEDLDLPHWAGVIPLKLTPGQIEPAPGVRAPIPDYLREVPSRWHEAPTLTGEHVILERLTMDHVDGLFAAVGRDDDVWRFLLNATPQTVDEMAQLVADAEVQQLKGARVPFVQRDAVTGEIVGTTSYYGIDQLNRSVNIGITALGQRWWRSGVNTESKLLLLTHAFETLGCVRVQWEAHSHNVRSHTAIERLGATREGTLRRHKKLADGTWRDTAVFGMTADEWPAAREALIGRLLPRPIGEA
ncbi:RimJ/RimL family protein N-acetyltransferase/nitroimidazol reductase NimA-like FMN-containing flavoprotein (pyridoxamine 5'-phosphate oxidase superfamily) [Allocatelliglobosispora scoriae]|uniref:RimJ/RimL family protein N-acetyltransferase/nitroimidazol reductase NimA-like FMN-containing flavoprotein (Pyridoxamine 5'-phosphate oxidase superfamily) n=1 Tax=Allocatelliglobosispora scoriae TaxID=643052 RepID=A0A841BZJ4_9ACTN|nr:bifunctional pyridoxamine 5'-phosphate oxidase family protein/GNAT family N-acetyltransferase [Allocatelliglobosispora scoriae]MBB5872323.1 RimJ/RimL family protein N-acetyltransferase/nitroimidazol reductase NimA-like FMN-containing flavoprotein (pyridoxamine 5'-phosphate oxidase superfamily) [Allocatelliglobosispora scoriae]